MDRANSVIKFTIHCAQPVRKSYLTKYRPLCLSRVIGELQQDFLPTPKVSIRTSDNNTSNSQSLPNFSDLRVTEIALQRATAYRQSSLLYKQESQASSSLENILKKKISHSRTKWKHDTESEVYHRMWRSLGRDLQHGQQENKKGGERESGSAKQRNSRRKRSIRAESNQTSASNYNMSTTVQQSSKPYKWKTVSLTNTGATENCSTFNITLPLLWLTKSWEKYPPNQYNFQTRLVFVWYLSQVLC